MQNTRRITESIIYTGASDRRKFIFEGIYPVPHGMSYNSYLINDEKTVLLDTADSAVSGQFFENLTAALGGKTLDYLIIQHMEPDHSAAVGELFARFPSLTVICSSKAADMLSHFHPDIPPDAVRTVTDGDTLNTGAHELAFISAPMVHWPEVIMTYDKTEGILFSADAFGTFGANDSLFADECGFAENGMDEARRYYCNIVGKYGAQVLSVLKKAEGLDIRMICPLHGPVHRSDIARFIGKYSLWASYKPEEKGVVIAYASVYGNTACAAEMLASRIAGRGITVKLFDVSAADPAEIVAAVFRYSHIVFASTTYNGGIFIKMEEMIRDLCAHGIRGRCVSFVENGSWAPTAAKQMRELLSAQKDMTFIGDAVTVRSAVNEESDAKLSALAAAVADSFEAAPAGESNISPAAPAGHAKKRFVCSVCGYVYEGDSLPEGFVCPLCHAGANAFRAEG